MADEAGTAAATAALAAAIRAGDRRALAQGITLVESTRPEHRRAARALLAALMPDAGRTARLGVSGAPGVGKSTFIEAFGLHLVSLGKRPAVLAVDPSSLHSGGSILGDKTRMPRLAREDAAFIRPTPAAGVAGGVARRTREALLLCEAAGYDPVLVETVGVGQAETAVAEMVDLFLLLLAPGAGDELQGIKRGIVELADLVVVNKADGALAEAAGRLAADYTAALGLMRPATAGWKAQVVQVSALEERGLDRVWALIERFLAEVGAAALAVKRAAQARAWMWRELREALVERLAADPAVAARLADLEARVAAGELSPSAAAEELLAVHLGGPKNPRTGEP